LERRLSETGLSAYGEAAPPTVRCDHQFCAQNGVFTHELGFRQLFYRSYPRP